MKSTMAILIFLFCLTVSFSSMGNSRSPAVLPGKTLELVQESQKNSKGYEFKNAQASSVQGTKAPASRAIAAQQGGIVQKQRVKNIKIVYTLALLSLPVMILFALSEHSRRRKETGVEGGAEIHSFPVSKSKKSHERDDKDIPKAS